ncbi:MAG: pyrroline-5-carboxylate reductase [Candidatus Symbiobacter sp.]|nr:pyrroline-5-carboxylate reductase [Candidatus Symbiobacter sp.]
MSNSEPHKKAANAHRHILVGAGKMGGGMLRGWLKFQEFRFDEFWVIEPNHAALSQEFAAESRVKFMPTLADALSHTSAPDADADAHADTDAVPKIASLTFAVKPQVFAEILPPYQDLIARHRPVVISIAAGQTIARIAGYFPNAAIVRAMPNLPSSIGRGLAVAVSNHQVSHDQRIMARSLLWACGKVFWIKDEKKMDAVTAVSGSGPAYVFYLTEILAAAGRDLGLPEDFADDLARQTVIGAAALLEQSNEAASDLRQNVTSPGGTTAAALKILMADTAELTEKTSFSDHFKAAVAAAAARSRELAAGG